MSEVLGVAFSTHNRADEMHIKMNRDCGSITKIYTSSSQIKSQDRGGEVGIKCHPSQEFIYNWLIAKR